MSETPGVSMTLAECPCCNESMGWPADGSPPGEGDICDVCQKYVRLIEGRLRTELIEPSEVAERLTAPLVELRARCIRHAASLVRLADETAAGYRDFVSRESVVQIALALRDDADRAGAACAEAIGDWASAIAKEGRQ